MTPRGAHAPGAQDAAEAARPGESGRGAPGGLCQLCGAGGRKKRRSKEARVSSVSLVMEDMAIIGVLFRLVWLEIDLAGFYSIYRGRLCFIKRPPMNRHFPALLRLLFSEARPGRYGTRKRSTRSMRLERGASDWQLEAQLQVPHQVAWNRVWTLFLVKGLHVHCWEGIPPLPKKFSSSRP